MVKLNWLQAIRSSFEAPRRRARPVQDWTPALEGRVLLSSVSGDAAPSDAGNTADGSVTVADPTPVDTTVAVDATTTVGDGSGDAVFVKSVDPAQDGSTDGSNTPVDGNGDPLPWGAWFRGLDPLAASGQVDNTVVGDLAGGDPTTDTFPIMYSFGGISLNAVDPAIDVAQPADPSADPTVPTDPGTATDPNAIVDVGPVVDGSGSSDGTTNQPVDAVPSDVIFYNTFVLPITNDGSTDPTTTDPTAQSVDNSTDPSLVPEVKFFNMAGGPSSNDGSVDSGTTDTGTTDPTVQPVDGTTDPQPPVVVLDNTFVLPITNDGSTDPTTTDPTAQPVDNSTDLVPVDVINFNMGSRPTAFPSTATSDGTSAEGTSDGSVVLTAPSHADANLFGTVINDAQATSSLISPRRRSR